MYVPGYVNTVSLGEEHNRISRPLQQRSEGWTAMVGIAVNLRSGVLVAAVRGIYLGHQSSNMGRF
jgi:hypothetical protein